MSRTRAWKALICGSLVSFVVAGMMVVAIAGSMDQTSSNASNVIVQSTNMHSLQRVSSQSRTFQSALERPLFHSTRRPFPPRPAEPEPTPMAHTQTPEVPTHSSPADHYVLRGVVISGVRRFALLESRDQGRVVRLSEGQQIESWILEGIGHLSAQFVMGGHRIELQLERPEVDSFNFEMSVPR